MAPLLIPTPSQCLQVGFPLFMLGGAIWFWRNGDYLIARSFPHWNWEKDLGWLNLKANRKAQRILRAATHVLHFGLLVALVGILFLTRTVAQPHDEAGEAGMLLLFAEWVYLFVCYGIWIYYLAAVLWPRVRDEFDAEELVRYRIEHPDLEEEKIAAGRRKIEQLNSNRARRF